MWELDCEEGWVLKNWCFWTAVLEKTLASPLDCKEIQPVHSEEDQPWDFFGGNDAKAESPVLRLPHAKCWLIGKDSDAGMDWGQEEKGMTEDEMAGWHHWLDGCESEWTLGVGDGQGGLAWCDSWGCRVGHDWVAELNWTSKRFIPNAAVDFLCPGEEVSAGSSHVFVLNPLLKTVSLHLPWGSMLWILLVNPPIKLKVSAFSALFSSHVSIWQNLWTFFMFCYLLFTLVGLYHFYSHVIIFLQL